MTDPGRPVSRPECPAKPADRRPRLLGVGLACLDYLFLSPWAERGGQAQVRDHVVCGGGLIGTAIAAAARLGGETAIWSWVGEDDEGQQVIAGLQAEGVDTSAVEVIPQGRTPVSFVHVQEGTGERTIYHRPRLEVPPERMRAAAERPFSCDVMLVDAIWPQASRFAAQRAREMGIPVVGDFCPEGEGADLARFVSHLIVPRACAELLAPGATREEQLRRLTELGPEFVAITAGADGCWFMAGVWLGPKDRHPGRQGRPRDPRPPHGAIAHQPSFPVHVVDTTGAGDVFHGAFAYALARRWPTERCVEFASAVAALSCRALGGRAGIPRLDEVERFLGKDTPTLSF